MDLGVPPALSASEEDGEVCEAEVKGSVYSLHSGREAQVWDVAGEPCHQI